MQTFWIFDRFLALLRLGAYTISNLDQFISVWVSVLFSDSIETFHFDLHHVQIYLFELIMFYFDKLIC